MRRNADGRMLQEALRRHVLRVLRCWRERFVFSDEFLNGLQVRCAHVALALTARTAWSPCHMTATRAQSVACVGVTPSLPASGEQLQMPSAPCAARAIPHPCRAPPPHV